MSNVEAGPSGHDLSAEDVQTKDLGLVPPDCRNGRGSVVLEPHRSRDSTVESKGKGDSKLLRKTEIFV